MTRQVKPLISADAGDARIRVLSLYKAWYRHIPFMVKDFDLPRSENQCREVLRSTFKKNAGIRDTRLIDMYVIKGQQDLKEVVEHWKQQPTSWPSGFLKTMLLRNQKTLSPSFWLVKSKARI